MILQLKRLFERVGDQQDICCEIPLEELGSFGGNISYVTPISLNGRIQNCAGMVSLDYTAKFALRHLCDRCLDEFDRGYSFSFEHILVRDKSSLNDEECVYCEGGALDLNELAISDMLVELPTKFLCSEDCEGLCSICGHNLNHGDCGCEADE